ncbi:MAG: ComEC family competence protein [Defluviitaleaceae bacterium]|nr:ComEC family competence protein [Defluviitaleaceae bacterium]
MSPVKRPVLWALGFLITGVMAGTNVFPVPFSPLVYVMLILFGVCVCGALHKRYRYWPVFLFALFLLAGVLRGVSRMETGIFIPESETEISLYGRVSDTGGLTAGGNRRVVVRAVYQGEPIRVMAYLQPHLPTVEIGQEIRMTGELLPLTRAANPGGYDAFLHLRTQKIDAIIRPTEVVAGDVHRNFNTAIRYVRDRIAAVFDSVLPHREAGIIRSMVLGDREALDRDLTEIYRVAGIRHILSISGLHITVLMLAVNAVLGKLIHPRKAGVATLIIMVLYCLMTGAATATVRAVFMGGALVFAKVLYRDYNLLTGISWACAALVLYEPLMVYNVGFQLSFGAVYGITLLTDPIERLLVWVRLPAYGKFRNGLAVSMAATFSTYVILAHHFYEIPLYSIFANVIIIPFVVALLVTGVVTGLVGLVWQPAAAVTGSVVFYILQLYEWVGRFFGALPFAVVRTGGGSVFVSLAGLAVLLIFAYVMNGFGTELKRRMPLLLFGIAALMLCVYLRDFPIRPQTTELDTLGNYTVHRRHNRVTVSGTGRGGENELLRYLDMRNVNRACALVITDWLRPQDIARILPVLGRVRVLYLPGNERLLPEALAKAVEANGITVIFY